MAGARHKEGLEVGPCQSSRQFNLPCATFGSELLFGWLAENLSPSARETGTLAIEGAAPILTARLVVTVEYLVSDPLTA
jgi:hypothetical protein